MPATQFYTQQNSPTTNTNYTLAVTPAGVLFYLCSANVVATATSADFVLLYRSSTGQVIAFSTLAGVAGRLTGVWQFPTPIVFAPGETIAMQFQGAGGVMLDGMLQGFTQ